MRRALLVAFLAALMVVAMVASAAFAGEVTGPSGEGAERGQNQGMSWCSFSGLNDEPDNPRTLEGTGPGTAFPDGPGGISQSYGQDVTLGADPTAGGPFHPGHACNPTRTILPANPNRTR